MREAHIKNIHSVISNFNDVDEENDSKRAFGVHVGYVAAGNDLNEPHAGSE